MVLHYTTGSYISNSAIERGLNLPHPIPIFGYATNYQILGYPTSATDGTRESFIYKIVDSSYTIYYNISIEIN